ncbi:hypothetical protein SERLA73DRAFT_102999 [Serpula lacrymans var. lacrymans S7.3]|uniref:NADPH-dependent diflavin oxidoreductase 1 n=2 Tax=Serpula lacrymans var. lacrymans TaxID=341189 RepID=F8PMW2_SERL3|nr:uncharacterized protein SERLADRAFT_446059 [Serpula lacrymans var. lacrymans S7.9]EGO02944.1 hypothetical protein SERLA73DRAFT_102999 [Serpula lacrymans var. lacrymans S7.3]EGO28631.1 hypothetical protein SERLADRAFT_446059 [Serpula lacrymans var. lacrymans S7.9]
MSSGVYNHPNSPIDGDEHPESNGDAQINEERTIRILYATETGTAQDTADKIARACRRIHFQCQVTNMNAYPPSELISEHLVIFVVATTGSGIEPRSMTPTWNMLLRYDLPEDLFEDIDFCVFGLGDTAYERFCWPAKKLSRRMLSLGANEICSRGEGDEQHHFGVDGALDPWIDLLLDTLLDLYPLSPSTHTREADQLYLPRVSICDDPSGKKYDSIKSLESNPGYHNATVKCNQRITADDWFQDVRHLEFSFERDIQYKPGDVAVIHPQASSADVDAFLLSVGWSNIADEALLIQHTMLDQTFPRSVPNRTTLRILFTNYLDFNAVPRRSFFQLLRHFATGELEKEKLDDFVSTEGADDLYDYCYRVKRTIYEVLSEFRSVVIPRDYIFDLFPPMRPRQFSIASSIQQHPREIHLCAAIVRYRTKLKIPRKGVCSTFLAALRPGDTLCIGIEKGFISLPQDVSTPMICVGPGTGVAPMRAVIEERIHTGSTETVLYFGCRSATKDQHYLKEWKAYAESGQLTYRVACSRDGPEGVKRTYVQDLIFEDGKRIWELVGEKRGWIVISGSSNKMPAAVRAALKEIIKTHGGKTEEATVEILAGMEREGRLIEECWS